MPEPHEAEKFNAGSLRRHPFHRTDRNSLFGKGHSLNNSDNEQLAAIALAEAKSPTLAITKQFFAVHRLAEEPVACVWQEHDCHWVYLRLYQERYYWIVRIELQNGHFGPTWGFHSPHATVYAAIFSQCVPAAEISAALSLPATEEKEKGAVMPGGRRTYDEHRWYYHPSVPDCLDFETKRKHLLSELPADKVQSLPEDCKVSINVAYYEYQDSPGGWHLESFLRRHKPISLTLWPKITCGE